MKNTKNLTQLAFFTALILMLGFTPLGFITVFATGITTVHIPVILGSYVFNVKQSCYLGFIFGLVSFIRCFTTPDAISAIVLGTGTGFGLYNLFLVVMIIFVPRILVGLFTNLSLKILLKITKKETLSMIISAVIGSLTNTIFLLGGLFVFASSQTSTAFGLDSTSTLFLVLAGIVAINGMIEAVFASVVSAPIGKVVSKYAKKD
ncbi:MAG: ECF transporter S component [Clostridia bacterium]